MEAQELKNKIKLGHNSWQSSATSELAASIDFLSMPFFFAPAKISATTAKKERSQGETFQVQDSCWPLKSLCLNSSSLHVFIPHSTMSDFGGDDGDDAG